MAASLEHNKRNKSSRYNPRLTYRSNKDRLHLNLHWENPIYANVNSSTELWELLREDYDYAKANNLTTRKRFISRTTNSSFTGTIETSITREIIFQIGKKGDTLVVPIEIFIHFIDWFKYEYEGDIIRWDIHDDEGTRHLHILVTTWNMEHHENYTLNSLVDTYHKFQSASYEELKPLCEQFSIKLQPSDGNDKHIPTLMHERHILVIETIVHKYESKARVLKRFARRLVNIIINRKQECIKLEDQCEVTLTNLKSLNEELIHETELLHKKDQRLRALTEEHETKVRGYEEYSNQLEQKIKQQRQESNSLANKIISDKHVLLNLRDETSKYTQQQRTLSYTRSRTKGYNTRVYN